jgi:hypothetical protein
LLIRYPLTLFAADIYLPRWLVQLRHDSAKRTQSVLMRLRRGVYVGGARAILRVSAIPKSCAADCVTHGELSEQIFLYVGIG